MFRFLGWDCCAGIWLYESLANDYRYIILQSIHQISLTEDDAPRQLDAAMVVPFDIINYKKTFLTIILVAILSSLVLYCEVSLYPHLNIHSMLSSVFQQYPVISCVLSRWVNVNGYPSFVIYCNESPSVVVLTISTYSLDGPCNKEGGRSLI